MQNIKCLNSCFGYCSVDQPACFHDWVLIFMSIPDVFHEHMDQSLSKFNFIIDKMRSYA